MIGTSSALIGAVVLLVLILVWIRADSTSRRLPSTLDGWLPDQGDAVEVCPPEFVSQIFSGQDLAFISRLEWPELKRHFLRERSAVALLCVQQTTTAIRRVMLDEAGLAALAPPHPPTPSPKEGEGGPRLR